MLRVSETTCASLTARGAVPFVSFQVKAQSRRQQKVAQQRDKKAEEEAAILRRLRRQPLVLTTHAQERLRARQLSEADIENVLLFGTVNWKLSKFGGKPSPVYVLEGHGSALAAATVAAEAAAQLDEPAPGHQSGLKHAGMSRDSASRVAEHGHDAAVAQAAGVEHSTVEAAAAAHAEAGLAVVLRQLRVPFAANDGATVALTVVDLQRDSKTK